MEKPLPLDELLAGLQEVYEEIYKKDIPKSLTLAINRMVSYAKSSEETALKIHKFAKLKEREKKLQIISNDVPPRILPSGFKAILHDVKIYGCGPDDRIYSRNADIQKMIPRGITIMQLDGHLSWFDLVVYGNKKFIGGIGDDDKCQPDNDEKWREYCLENPDTASKVVCMTKLNGEAAHFTGRYIDGLFYVFTGSKNVHMMIRDDRDINQYEGSRYGVAKIIARAVCDTMKGLEHRKHQLLYSLLHHTKCTAVCEILQPDCQHIVRIDHLKQPELCLISFTPMATTEKETSLTAIPPDHALDLSFALGLIPAPYTVIATPNALKHRNRIRQGFSCEGQVLYFLNQNEDTIGLAKVKTIWYVLLRALREKVINFFTNSKKPRVNVADCIISTHKRFVELQKWLKFSDSYLQQWKKLGASFVGWLNEEIKHKHLESKRIRPDFPSIWEQFLEVTNQTDRIELN